jgi:hypothetical protein
MSRTCQASACRIRSPSAVLPTLPITHHAHLRRISPLLYRSRRTAPSQRRDPSGAGPEEKGGGGGRCAAARQCALLAAARGPRGRLRGDGRRGRRYAVFTVASPFLVADTCGTNPVPITIVLGEVLAQWPQMFRIMNLFRMLLSLLCWCDILMT